MTDLNILTAKFIDAFKIDKPSDKDYKLWKESFKDSFNENKQVLRIVMKASHSAFINRNNRFYIPSRMRDGVDTFINGNKPAKVLLNHDSDIPPVGIIREAKYIDTIPEDLIENKDVVTLLNSKARIENQLDAFKSLVKDGIVSRDGWEGLGYVELTADIMDNKTIEMILDGRYDAVSTYFDSPGNAYCFICYTNWAAADKFPACEHKPGKVYEDENEDEWPMMLIPTLHMNKEVSFVLKDADPLTSVSISDNKKDGLNTHIQYDDSWNKNLQTFNSKYEFKDKFEEDNNMSDKKTKKITELSDEAKAVLNIIKEVNPDMEEAKLNEFADTISKMKIDEKYPNQDEAEIDEKSAVINAFDFLTNTEEVNADNVYAEMENEFADMVKDGSFTEEQIKDAKLSTEAREKLSASTFCGPNKSFPVPDCAHVTAAKRLLGHYKGPGDKTKILASVNRKAVALGCTSQAKDVTEETSEVKFEMPSCECLAVASDEEARALFAKAEAELISRNLTVQRECSVCADSLQEAQTAKDSLKAIEDKIKEYENIVKVLRGELRFQAVDYATQVDTCIALEAKVKEAKAEKLAIVGTLSGKYENLDSAKESLSTENITAIEDSIMTNFDLTSAVTKLHDGMDHLPKKDDTLLDNVGEANLESNIITDSLDSTGKAALETFKDFVKDDKIEEAKAYFSRMRMYDVFPEQFEFDKLLAAYTKVDTAE